METVEILRILAICLGSYLLGSIPMGLIVGKLKGIDVRKVGSGNIGATNAGRALGIWYGVLVASLDAAKGALAVIIAKTLPVIFTAYIFWQPHWWWLAALAWSFAFLGHLFPIWLKFRGGKGVSVFVGGLIGLLDWKISLILMVCWAIIFLFFVRRKMSATNLMFGAGILLFILAIPALVAIAPVVAIIVILMWWAHRENFKKLARGLEPSLRLPSSLIFFNKLPDDLIGFCVNKLQSVVKKLQEHQNKP